MTAIFTSRAGVSIVIEERVISAPVTTKLSDFRSALVAFFRNGRMKVGAPTLEEDVRRIEAVRARGLSRVEQVHHVVERRRHVALHVPLRQVPAARVGRHLHHAVSNRRNA